MNGIPRWTRMLPSASAVTQRFYSLRFITRPILYIRLPMTSGHGDNDVICSRMQMRLRHQPITASFASKTSIAWASLSQC